MRIGNESCANNAKITIPLNYVYEKWLFVFDAHVIDRVLPFT